MQYRNFGKTALQVSEIGFGGWAIGGSWGTQNENDSLAALNKDRSATHRFESTYR